MRKLLDVPSGYSTADLLAFRAILEKENPNLVGLVEQYVQLAERYATDVQPPDKSIRREAAQKNGTVQMHLFDLLRQKRLFPLNNDLADFAARILPHMRRHRFDKMSRGDIVTRIIEYVESLDARTREQLENSMRDAMRSGTGKAEDKKSFFSKWEKIIKGIEL